MTIKLPAEISQGVTIVISPLVSLIQDQILALQAVGIAADYLGTGQTEDSIRKIYSSIASLNIH